MKDETIDIYHLNGLCVVARARNKNNANQKYSIGILLMKIPHFIFHPSIDSTMEFNNKLVMLFSLSFHDSHKNIQYLDEMGVGLYIFGVVVYQRYDKKWC